MLGLDSVYDPILAESAEIHAIVEDFLSFCQAAARRRQRARPAGEVGLPAATGCTAGSSAHPLRQLAGASVRDDG